MNILRRRVSEGVKGSVTLKIYPQTTSSPTSIIYNPSSIAELIIDGTKQPSVVTSYTFTSINNHTIICKFKDGKIGDSAFAGIYDINSVDIDSDIIGIGNSAFSNCRVSTLTIPKTVEYIGRSAFSGCTNLHTLKVASAAIGAGAFGGCMYLSSLTLQEGVVYIGGGAFASAGRFYGALSVTIPLSVKNIESGAFYDMGTVTCLPVTPPSAGTNIFNSVNQIRVPASSVTAYRQASGWSTYESEITSL